MSRSMTLAQAAANRISMSLVQEARVNEPVPGPDTNVNDMSMTPPPTSAPTSSRASKQSSITMPQVNEPKLRDPFEVADQFASTITLVIDDLFIVHGPLDEWLVPSSIGFVHDLEIEDDEF